MVGIRRRLSVFQNERVGSPYISGLLFKRVVLPFREYSRREAAVFLMHELYHYKLRHLAWRHLMLIVSCVYWFCPPVYCLSDRLADWEEIMCDIFCCERNGGMFRARDYYNMILGLLEKPVQSGPGILCLAGSQRGLDVRVRRFCLYRQRRSSRKVSFVLLVLHGAFALALTAAVIGLLYGCADLLGSLS